MTLPSFVAIATLALAPHASLRASNAPDAPPAQITVRVGQPQHAVSPLLWGIFFEDINLSADGGIYPEFVRNRSFEDADKPEFWTLAPGSRAELAIDTRQPLTPFNRKSLRVRAEGAFGLLNDGYWGMNVVQGERYRARFAARAGDGFKSKVTLRLETADDRVLAQGEVSDLSSQWKWYDLDLEATASDPKARLRLAASGQGTLWLDMVSVLPAKTWRNHGLRPDLCEMLAALRPAFVRFPGGCWVEGDDVARMYRWKTTIGDVANRIPLWNIWGYYATHGLGYHEYLQLSEDLAAEPLFCINVGMSHHEVVPMDQMGDWVQDALDAIEYANGPVTSVWGGHRARQGHPEPFKLRYLEIGNENGGPAYHERWPLFHRAIKAKYPDIQLIANVWGGYPTNPMPDIIDEHYYNNPEFFMQHAGHYDTYDRKGPKVFVGEYAVTQGCGQGNLRGAIGEAAFMTGLERNSDIVVMAAYAPLFVNVNHRKWNPDLINFDSSRVYGLPSYYVQKLFAEHPGDRVLPIQTVSPEVSSGPKGGTVGVGTWLTQAEFKDIRVTHEGTTLYQADFASGMDGWKRLGNGDWNVQEGALRQNRPSENVRAVVTGRSWTNYTYALKARKLGGEEGFLILFRVNNENEKSWWNLGGWGNKRHALELGGVLGKDVDGRIETGRWYDIRIDVTESRIRCYLDGQLMHDAEPPSIKALYASATTDAAQGETILKVVNAAADPVATGIQFDGARDSLTAVQLIELTSANPTDENSLEQPTKVAPTTRSIHVAGPRFQHVFPGNSLTVLRAKTK